MALLKGNRKRTIRTTRTLRTLRLVLVCLWGLGLFGVYGQDDVIQPARYVSAKFDYSIQFPPTWEVIKGAVGTDVIALAPAEGVEDLFRKNVNIVSAQVDLKITREEYYARNMEGLRQFLEDFDLENSRDLWLDDVPARELLFTHTMGVVSVRAMQYLILLPGKAFVITFTANRSDFAKYQPQFKEIIRTLTFTKPS